MIDFRFAIQNPFVKHTDVYDQTDYILVDQKISDDRNLEIQFTRWSATNLFLLEVSTQFEGEDHAGPSFSLEILGFWFHIKAYHHRHWNYDLQTWYTDEAWKKEIEPIVSDPIACDYVPANKFKYSFELEKFDASLEQVRKYNVRYNDNIFPNGNSDWYVYNETYIVPVQMGDLIGKDAYGNTIVNPYGKIEGLDDKS